MMPIILPAGTEYIWRHSNSVDDPGQWSEFAIDLVCQAAAEPDLRIKGDLITLALVARERANLAAEARPFPIF